MNETSKKLLDLRLKFEYVAVISTHDYVNNLLRADSAFWPCDRATLLYSMCKHIFSACMTTITTADISKTSNEKSERDVMGYHKSACTSLMSYGLQRMIQYASAN